ncbi:MAG: hypothetical protein ACRD6W_02900, partial [Nitrososphaerales archaeon]
NLNVVRSRIVEHMTRLIHTQKLITITSLLQPTLCVAKPAHLEHRQGARVEWLFNASGLGSPSRENH